MESEEAPLSISNGTLPVPPDPPTPLHPCTVIAHLLVSRIFLTIMEALEGQVLLSAQTPIVFPLLSSVPGRE